MGGSQLLSPDERQLISESSLENDWLWVAHQAWEKLVRLETA